MTDPLDRAIAGIDGPRAPDPEFRARLEALLTDRVDLDEAARPRWDIDGPREPPARLRARLEASLIRRRRHPRPVTAGIAAAVTGILVASSMVVADRVGSRRTVSAPTPPVLSPTPSPSASPSPSVKPPVRTRDSLTAFGSPSQFLRYVRGEALKLVGPYGIEGGAHAYGNDVGPVTPITAPMASARTAQAPGFSTTNIQEAGVDEPDIVKTDGRRMVVLSGSTLYVLDVSHGRTRLRGSLEVHDGTGLFLAGDRVIHVGQRYQAPVAAERAVHVLQRPWTNVTVLGIATPAAPRVISSFAIEGSYVGARLSGGVVRLIVQSGALGPPPVAPEGNGSERSMKIATTRNKLAVRRSIVGDWLPHYVLQRPGRRATTGHVHDWDAVSRPPERAGLGMLTVLTIDPDDPRPDNAVSVVGAGDKMYASRDALYVTSSPLDELIAARAGRQPKGPVTRIHKFDIRDPKQTRYIGSGAVPGYLLNQFAMSEFEGHLRVATTLGFPGLTTTSKSSVTVLREREGALVPVGSVGDLGRGERIYSVRFIGSMGYVVTFRQIDPLYVIDLRTPTRPKLMGELKVPGYSGYLHPLSETVLLGIGRDADEQGMLKGLQLSLFDVSDPADPARLDDEVFGVEGSYSDAESDHHAFLYWEPERLAVLPAVFSEKADQSSPFNGALAIKIDPAAGFGKVVRLTHAGRGGKDDVPSIRRAVVIGDRLLTVSALGVLVSDLDTLAARAWVALRG